MPDLAWVLIHAAQDSALVASLVLTWAAMRRLGAHTPYGTFLFLFACGLWLLLMGDLVFVAKDVAGAWERPGTLADLYSLGGWALLASGFTLLAAWFHAPGRTDRVATWAAIGAAAGGAAVALVALALVSSPSQDPSFWWRAAYIALDGASMGALVLGGRRLLWLRQTTLGRLYVFLAGGLLLKFMADLAWAATTAADATVPAVSFIYPVGGLLLLLGLWLQWGDIRRLGSRPSLHEPWLRREQLALHDFAEALTGLVGRGASKAWLEAAARPVLGSMEVRLDGGTLDAAATDAQWRTVMEAAHRAAGDIAGPLGRRTFEEIQASYLGEAPR